MGHDPKDVKATERLIKKKNDDIAALKKQLKIPPLHHPQTIEVIETQKGQEELMDLVLKLNDQLKETEKELDTLIQSKQSELATTSTTAIPTVTTIVPSTLVASLAPTTPPATALPVTTESITAGTSTKETTELVKAMEEMSIHSTKLRRLREKVAILDTDCNLTQIHQREETQKALRMGEKIKVLEKYLTLQKPLR